MTNITLIYDITDIRCLTGCVDDACITIAAVKSVLIYTLQKDVYTDSDLDTVDYKQQIIECVGDLISVIVKAP